MDGEAIKFYVATLNEALSINARCALRSDGMWRTRFSRLPDVVRFYDVIAPTIERKRRRFEEAKAHFLSGEYRISPWGCHLASGILA